MEEIKCNCGNKAKYKLINFPLCEECNDKIGKEIKSFIPTIIVILGIIAIIGIIVIISIL